MENITVLNDIVQFIKENDNFIITSHIDPDGDNIASQLAMYSLFKKLNKKAIILDQDPVPERYEFLLNNEVIYHKLPSNNEFSALFVVDVAVLRRIGKDILNYTKHIQPIINIDHHRSNSYFGKYNFVDGSACSATVMIYQLAKALKIEWDAEIATRIYSGMMTDTGGFRFQNTNEKALVIAAEMVKYGAVPGEIAYHVYSQRPFSVIKLLQQAEHF